MKKLNLETHNKAEILALISHWLICVADVLLPTVVLLLLPIRLVFVNYVYNRQNVASVRVNVTITGQLKCM